MPTISITAHDGGSFTGYLAIPASGHGPGLVVAQEIFGVNAVMRGICDDLAAQGFVALCPDLFWRQEPGVDITDGSEAEWQKAFALYQGFNEALGVEDMKASLAALRARPEISGKVGSLGYCLGGKLAWLMATRSDADCAVSYYGVGIDAALGEADRISKPLLMHLAGKDSYVPADAQDRIRAALAGNPLVSIYGYADQDHAFARTNGNHWDPEAAALANGRTSAFLDAHLR